MSIDTQAQTATLQAQVARMIRERLGAEELTRADLARRLNVHETWVGKRLKGRTEITLDDLERIAEVLGVTIVDLLPRDRREATVTSAHFEPARLPDRPHGRHDSARPAGRGGPPNGPGRTARTSRSLAA